MAKQTKTEQLDAFKDFTDEQLDQVAKFIIGRDFEEGLTREDKLKELIAAKRKDTTVAKSVAVVNGQEIECPKGFAVVTIHPKNGSEWGEKSREVYFAHIHGETLVAQRGVPTRIKEKFYHQLKNSTWEERTQSTQADPARGVAGSISVRRLGVETFDVHAFNPDLEEAERVERELKENAAATQKAKKQQQIIKDTLLNTLTG